MEGGTVPQAPQPRMEVGMGVLGSQPCSQLGLLIPPMALSPGRHGVASTHPARLVDEEHKCTHDCTHKYMTAHTGT